MQIGQHIEKGPGEHLAPLPRHPLPCIRGGVQSMARHVTHDIKMCTGDMIILAKTERAGDRHRGRSQCGNDCPFPTHVVRFG